MTCSKCDKGLVGKQTKYCSKKCCAKDTNNKNQNYAAQKKRSYERKLECVKELGGKCYRCGYNKNLAALQFHHRDPEIKEDVLDARSLSNRTIEWIKNELKKCDLLCANCHTEYHHPTFNLVGEVGFEPTTKRL